VPRLRHIEWFHEDACCGLCDLTNAARAFGFGHVRPGPFWPS
jgi:hypothetical protein